MGNIYHTKDVPEKTDPFWGNDPFNSISEKQQGVIKGLLFEGWSPIEAYEFYEME